MNRRLADALVGSILVGFVALGALATVQAVRHSRAMSGMMGGMSGMAGLASFWYGFGTVLVVVALGGGYLLVRESITDATGVSAVEKREEDEPRLTDSTAGRSPPRLLDALPEDERRILEPVLDSPGITQIELRDRASFSKAKISQTVSELEKRGLLYRERQGRTYRVYPDERIEEPP
jgi:DNA-binding transcriptional ArsR family regulator